MSTPRFDPLVDEAIEKLGVKWQQLLVVVPGGGALAFNSGISIMVAISADGLLGDGQSKANPAALMSLLFVGYTLGNLLGGFLADWYGRRFPVIVGFAALLVLQLLLIFIGGRGFWLPAILVTAIGFAMGVPLAAANAGMKEWSPARFRSMFFGLLFLCLAIGQLSPLVIVWFLAPDLDVTAWQWRLLFGMSAALAAFLSVFAFLLRPESAQWLNDNKGGKAAVEQLRSAARWNLSSSGHLEDDWRRRHLEAILEKLETVTWVEDPVQETTPLQNKPHVNTPRSGFRQVLSGSLLLPTIILSFTTTIANATYYGLMFALPRTFAAVFTDAHLTPADMMIITALCEFPGIVLQMGVGSVLSRRINIAVMFCLLTASAALLGVGLSWTSWSWAVTVGAVGMKTFAISCFIITYMVVSEIYPTSCRGIGIGFCLTVGRLGAICSPVAHDSFSRQMGNESFFFFSIATGTFIAACSGCLLPIDS